jgi:8-oxo-dGTP diphosphatase
LSARRARAERPAAARPKRPAGATAASRGARFPCPRCGAPLFRRPRVANGRREAPEIECPTCRYRMFDYPRICVGMVVVKGDHLLVLRRGHPPRRGFVDLPGGFLEAGEALSAGAQRELHEETGLRVRDVELLGVYWDRYHLSGFGWFPTMNFYFIGRWTRGEPKPADDAAGAMWRPIARAGRGPDRLAWRHMRDVFRDVRRRCMLSPRGRSRSIPSGGKRRAAAPRS